MTVVWDFIGNSANWSGDGSIPQRVLEHLGYSFLALFFIVLIGLPLGLYIGHTGRGGVAIAGAANALRALPSFGLLVYLVLVLFDLVPSYLFPTMVVLVILGIPAVLSGAYSGVESVDPAARDAARGMGMTGSQVLWRVEVPNALPLIISGIRSAMLQVVATAMIAAYVSLGGLGRYIIDGLAQSDYPQMAAGAVPVALLAVGLDLLFGGLQRLVVSPGVTRRYARIRRIQGQTAPRPEDAAISADVPGAAA